MSMNWSDLIEQAEEGGGFEAIPAGDYVAEIIETNATPASTGKPMVKATFKILEGPFTGRLVWNNFVLTKDNPNALKWFFRHMATLGMDRSFFAANPSMDAVAAQMKGKQVVLTLSADRMYQGAAQNDVKAMRRLDTPLAPSAPAPAAVVNPSPSAPAEEQPAPAATNGGAPAVPF